MDGLDESTEKLAVADARKDHEKSEKKIQCFSESSEAKCETDQTEEQDLEKSTSELKESFKKPVLITEPRRGNASKLKTLTCTKDQSKSSSKSQFIKDSSNSASVESQIQLSIREKCQPLPYKEPSWGGVPKDDYKLEVLKCGIILETINLSKKSNFVVGRLPICDIALAHPTISRYHAIIQYRKEGDDKNDPGMYIYDLESTHGTFWNGKRIMPNIYARIQDGHMIAFGCSQRKFILQAPTNDREEESELTVTELKEKRRLQLEEEEKIRIKEHLRMEDEERLKKEKQEAEGIDWGMGEDADEETDLTENPFAQSDNEKLFLDDPKKTLKGWFEREGYDLRYQVEDKGIGRFACTIDLPIDSSSGGSTKAEVIINGKKKEAIIQCALEACRILDRHGLLRQATHEGRKRKTKNWEEDNFYDSDEDEFLDRTGTIEKKRMQRMKQAGKLNEKADTYDTLLEKRSLLAEKIKKLEKTLALHKSKQNTAENSTVDPLDAFMSSLNSATLNKSDIRQMKCELINLQKEETQLLKLINMVKPVNLPSLDPHTEKNSEDYNYNNAKLMASKKPKLEIMIKNNLSEKTRKIKKVSNISSNKVFNLKHEETLEVEIMSRNAINNQNDDRSPGTLNTSITEYCSAATSSSLNEEKPEESRRENKKIRPKDKRENPKFDDSYRENYSTWVFPEDQSGDGRTCLNDKYGY